MDCMRRHTKRLAWSAFATGAAALASVVAHKTLENTWKQLRRKDPPLNPAAATVTWGEALAWGIAAGVAAGISQVVARRGAVAAWTRFIGEPPKRNK
jgi:hypothetical protein